MKTFINQILIYNITKRKNVITYLYLKYTIYFDIIFYFVLTILKIALFMFTLR